MGHIFWRIADRCNYKCPYCIESRFLPESTRLPYVTETMMDAVFRFLSGLESGWIIRLASGEPSTHPKLFEITAGITRCGHQAAMETNLSLPLSHYERFIAAADNHPAFLHATLHLGQADLEAFLAKCVTLHKLLADLKSSLYIASVVTSENFRTLIEIARRFERHGLSLHFQRQFKEGRYLDLPLEMWRLVQPYLEPVTASFKIENPLGTPCLAGSRWLVIDMGGDVWCCHSALLRGEAAHGHAGEGFLGNLTKDMVVPYPESRGCPFTCCCYGQPRNLS